MIAEDLLNKYLQYICFWKAAYGAKNPPSDILQKQICALMKAADIFPDSRNFDEGATYFDFFERGAFLERKTHNIEVLTPKMMQFIDSFIDQSDHSERLNHMRDDIDYRYIFINLLSFRTQIEQFFIPTHIRYEGFGSFDSHFCNHQTEKVLKPLKETIKEVNEILHILINPTQKSINEETLIAHYEYPTEDLRSVAIDWFANGF